MGSSAGTGVRSFAEGGSTSTPTGDASAAPQRAIYQPQYADYGLGSTPQAQGRLASILNMGNYGNQMPTFTRPQAPPPQAQYSIPYRTTPDSSFGNVLQKVVGNISNAFPGRGTSSQEPATLTQSINEGKLTEAQYQMMMKNPTSYLSYMQSIQSGNAPTTGYQPIPYMTTAQQKAYNARMSRELDALIRPITVFDEPDESMTTEDYGSMRSGG